MHKYYRTFFIFIFAVSFFAVVSSYVMEIQFGMSPCKLCYYQRWTYIVLTAICAFGYFSSKYSKIAMVMVFLALAFGTGTAFTHMAIEQGWIQLDLSCTSNFTGKIESIEDFKSMISDKEIVPCDMPRYNFFGITLAGWNFIYSSVILMFASIVIFSFLPRVRFEEKFGHDHGKNKKKTPKKKR